MNQVNYQTLCFLLTFQIVKEDNPTLGDLIKAVNQVSRKRRFSKTRRFVGTGSTGMDTEVETG